MKTLLFVLALIGACVIGAVVIVYCNNKDAQPKLHPDKSDPKIWYDNEGRKLRKL